MKRVLPIRAGARWIALSVCQLLVSFLCGCFVDGHCRLDEDCDSPEICNDDRFCVLECRDDDDCALGDTCDEHRCEPAPGCAGCNFSHAEAICVHGDCSMGSCNQGWVDANARTTDGCEYFCTPSGAEICDEIDNDCDALVDEDFDLTTDVNHCGECDHACPEADHTIPICAGGHCGRFCEEDWFDNNGLADDGCEDSVCVPRDEVCDGADNNCDGDVDEGFDKTLPSSCGELCVACEYAHARDHCIDGLCAMGACEEGWHDLNERANDGCEYACEITGDEICDGVDNDCDGDIDEELLCCPENMVTIDGVFCIDVYEASIQENEDGDLLAVSLPGVAPFWDRDLTVEQASAYCEAAGKRLCNPTEWVQTCRGPDELLYCYGDEYEPTICNGIDTFGEGNYHLTTTASFESCTNDYGIFDINGNVWEMTSDGLMRGGAYNCRDSATLHQCTYTIEPSRVIAIGFRCCF